MQIKAKKRFGQNFLKDEEVLYKIIEAMPKNNNHIVEIGPGLGDLTNKLVKIKDVTAYEVDKDLFAILNNKFANEIEKGNLRLNLADVLDVWQQKQTLYDGKFDLIANLPYYIATNIILNSLDDKNCDYIIVMVQKEVANKFCAKVGEREYLALSVIATLQTKQVKIITNVSPTSFKPPPKVDSSVILLEKNGVVLEQEFKEFLKIAFIAPRKKLIKNLSKFFDNDKLINLFQSFDLDLNIRPHQVEASLYQKIYQSL
jgi:16S rRNA (adenine1518-N6/adenine1519-N6)-dimethyltransferase